MTNSFTPCSSSSPLHQRSLGNIRIPSLPDDLLNNSDSPVSQVQGGRLWWIQQGTPQRQERASMSRQQMFERSLFLLDQALEIMEDDTPHGPDKQ
ncbi:unnamed protein product [Cylindrotheca closterium]|uniref:Uncharacterized protein n=1 Tax=Cylindrotheca closterium TaxID=2856 RepID=A0AAD2PX84_9STRA|nr:unnamed protein product [Cylindrotheca closterium]